METIISIVQTTVPVLGGFGILILLLWQFFWRLDKRSQQEIAVKENEIKDLNDALILKDRTIDQERTLRRDAEDRASKAESREQNLETSIQDLKDQLTEVRNEVTRLRSELAAARSGGVIT